MRKNQTDKKFHKTSDVAAFQSQPLWALGVAGFLGAIALQTHAYKPQVVVALYFLSAWILSAAWSIDGIDNIPSSFRDVGSALLKATFRLIALLTISSPAYWNSLPMLRHVSRSTGCYVGAVIVFSFTAWLCREHTIHGAERIGFQTNLAFTAAVGLLWVFGASEVVLGSFL